MFYRRALQLTLALLLLLVSRGSSIADEEAGFKSIFNGKDLTGWSGNETLWRVEEGAITGQTTPEKRTKGNTFLIWRQGVVDDFELKLSYRIENGNSGIQYRSVDFGNHVVGGHQADFESGDNWSGAHYEERGRGTLARRGQVIELINDVTLVELANVQNPDGPPLQSYVKKDDWNEYHIIAHGRRMIHKINDVIMSDVTENSRRFKQSGILALQLHVGPPMKVQFKDVRLKRMPMTNGQKVVFLAGSASHGRGAHEHLAGCKLLALALNENLPSVHAVVYENGWPTDPTALDNANAIVMYADGGRRHPVLAHLDEVDALNKKGVGVACIHYGVEVPKGPGGERFLDWMGGYFEPHWSVNPHWTPNFRELPAHPITRGVQPFSLLDEWYYHMRFRDEMAGVTPILSAVAPKNSVAASDSPHGGNPTVRAAVGRGEPQHVAWASQQEGRGRGFGFTGGHFHRNWGNDDFRKLVLNALAWTAGAEVPENGVSSKSLSDETLDRLLGPRK